MKNLSTAIMTRFNATSGTPAVHNAFWLSVGGKLRKERAESTDVPPYSVYHIISDVYSFMFAENFETVRIQFDLFSLLNSSSEVEDMFTNLKALYDWAPLTITGNVHLYTRRELARLTKDPTDDCWIYNVDYTIMMEKR